MHAHDRKQKVLIAAIFTSVLVSIGAFFLFPRPVHMYFASSETLYADTRQPPYNITINVCQLAGIGIPMMRSFWGLILIVFIYETTPF